MMLCQAGAFEGFPHEFIHAFVVQKNGRLFEAHFLLPDLLVQVVKLTPDKKSNNIKICL
jgi:hypothetical protein